jgi:hypothetical protein
MLMESLSEQQNKAETKRTATFEVLRTVTMFLLADERASSRVFLPDKQI